MNFTKRQLYQYWILVPLVLWLAFILIPSALSFWTDSEMWAASATKYFFSNRPEYYFGTKPLFHLLLNLNTQLAAWLHVHPMTTARTLMCLNTIGLLYVFYRLLEREGGKRLAWVGFAFLISISFFEKRAGHVRSDMLAAHILLWCLYYRPLLNNKRHWAFWWLAIAISMLVTPKSAVWVIALTPLWNLGWRPSKKSLLMIGALSIITLAAALFIPALNHFFADPITFFLNSFVGSEVGVSYFSLARLMYVFRLARENPHFVLAFLVFGIWGYRMRHQGTSFGRNFQLSGSLLFLFFALYPDRLPFMIVALLPFWILQIMVSAPVKTYFAENGPASAKTVAFCAVAFSILSTVYWGLETLSSHSNRNQLVVSQWLQNQVDVLPRIEIYDPVGILPFTQAHYWFVGPGQAAKNRWVLNNIQTVQPELIFYTAKLNFLEPFISRELHEHYHHDGTGIFVRKYSQTTQASSIPAYELRKKLTEEFPRLAGQASVRWTIENQITETLKIKTSFGWSDLEADRPIALPPGTQNVMITPFKMDLPYSLDIFRQFAFDVDF